ncbi:hypothetical protein PCANC_07724 [Puccinia coronata f. sp. avenae]|uniref:Uncharacterized protein n=1 Tax=Puccinia coronata f. sp. avenae TaxID=200324 RepID=A0A2N5VRB5_9BASI|nr:hypothetical protein PCANC_07724 [Puccinia coronata f. sp. avenae]
MRRDLHGAEINDVRKGESLPLVGGPLLTARLLRPTGQYQPHKPATHAEAPTQPFQQAAQTTPGTISLIPLLSHAAPQPSYGGSPSPHTTPLLCPSRSPPPLPHYTSIKPSTRQAPPPCSQLIYNCSQQLSSRKPQDSWWLGLFSIWRRTPLTSTPNWKPALNISSNLTIILIPPSQSNAPPSPKIDATASAVDSQLLELPSQSQKDLQLSSPCSNISMASVMEMPDSEVPLRSEKSTHDTGLSLPSLLSLFDHNPAKRSNLSLLISKGLKPIGNPSSGASRKSNLAPPTPASLQTTHQISGRSGSSPIVYPCIPLKQQPAHLAIWHQNEEKLHVG